MGVFKIVLKQKEAGFRYKSVMVVPKDINVWGTLGMQNRLIDDNSFLALNMKKFEMTLLDYMLFTRLNAPGMLKFVGKLRFCYVYNVTNILILNELKFLLKILNLLILVPSILTHFD